MRPKRFHAGNRRRRAEPRRRMRPRGPSNARSLDVPKPERPKSMLRSPVVGRIEPSAIDDAVSGPPKRSNLALDGSPTVVVLRSRKVGHQTSPRSKPPNQFDAPPKHLEPVLLLRVAIAPSLRRTRRIHHQQIHPPARPPRRHHPHQIPRIHPNRSNPKIPLVRRTRIRVDVECHPDLNPRPPNCLRKPTSPGEHLDDVHGVPRVEPVAGVVMMDASRLMSSFSASSIALAVECTPPASTSCASENVGDASTRCATTTAISRASSEVPYSTACSKSAAIPRKSRLTHCDAYATRTPPSPLSTFPLGFPASPQSAPGPFNP